MSGYPLIGRLHHAMLQSRDDHTAIWLACWWWYIVYLTMSSRHLYKRREINCCIGLFYTYLNRNKHEDSLSIDDFHQRSVMYTCMDKSTGLTQAEINMKCIWVYFKFKVMMNKAHVILPFTSYYYCLLLIIYIINKHVVLPISNCLLFGILILVW